MISYLFEKVRFVGGDTIILKTNEGVSIFLGWMLRSLRHRLLPGEFSGANFAYSLHSSEDGLESTSQDMGMMKISDFLKAVHQR